MTTKRSKKFLKVASKTAGGLKALRRVGNKKVTRAKNVDEELEHLHVDHGAISIKSSLNETEATMPRTNKGVIQTYDTITL
jgi:hypothetical protein